MPKPLKIGVDIRDLRIAKTGTGTYLSEVCEQFRRMDGKKYTFCFLDTPVPVYTGENKLLKLVEHIRFSFWKQVVLPMKAWLNGCDIVFCTDYFVPWIRLNFRTITVFHDAFFFEHPEYYNKLWLSIFKMLAVPAAKKADYVVAPTDYARDRISMFTGIGPEKLITIYEGPKSFQPQTGVPAVLSVLKEQLNGAPFLLHVGIMNKRKNLPALIRALKLVRKKHRNYKLILAGKPDPKKHSNDDAAIRTAIAENGLEQDVILTGYLSDAELAWLYKNASLYVFPSINEGFGIPVIEAFKHRLPVIVANNSCLPEVGGDAVLTFDPRDPEDICDKIQRVLDDPSLRTSMIAAGERRLNTFTWENTAVQLLELFGRIKKNG